MATGLSTKSPDMRKNASCSAARSGRTRACSFPSRKRLSKSKPRTCCASTRAPYLTRISAAAPKPIWRCFWPPRLPGKLPTPACSSTADSASQPSTMWNASSAKRACTRSRPSRRISFFPTWPSMCSVCHDHFRNHMESLAPRSYLFVPGNRPDRYVKAIAAGADAVIVDLEDAVPPKDKTSARAALAAWLSPEHPVLIRVNGAESSWFREDLALCKTPGVAGVLLPKAQRIEDIRLLAEHSGAATPILPLIETARGFWNAHALAQGPRVQRFVFGSIDFQIDLGIQGEEEELLYFRSQLVLVSRIAGLEPPVDGVTTAIDDAERVRGDTLRGTRKYGGLASGAPASTSPAMSHGAGLSSRSGVPAAAWPEAAGGATCAMGSTLLVSSSLSFST